MKRSLLAAAVAVAALAASAPSALADSIAYVKDGNVWLSTPDGSRQFQVTSAGGYGDAKLAVRSQYWMLGIMVGFTSLALWLLAQAGS